MADIRLGGHMVAFERSLVDLAYNRAEFIVLDLHRGKVLHRIERNRRALVLNSDSSAAWTTQYDRRHVMHETGAVEAVERRAYMC